MSYRAMSSSTGNLDPPLADYFWIAGIDSISYGEHLARGGVESTRKSFTDQLLVAIEAEEEAHGSSLLVPSTNGSSRRSNGSSDRLSGGSILQPFSPSSEPPQPAGLVRNSSNSSNSTITEANRGSNNNGRPVTVRRDFDFDKALLKFAAERDSFLEDLSFSAGTVVPSKPLMHPRAQKVVNEEPKLEKQNSLRRRISLRDLTSMRRSPSNVNRACKFYIALLLRIPISALTLCDSIDTDSEANVELQFRDSGTSTLEYITKHAPIETKV